LHDALPILRPPGAEVTLTDFLARRGLRHVQIGSRTRVTLGRGWVAWIVPNRAGYSLTAERGAGGAPEAMVKVDTEAEAADLALTWLADAREGRFTVRCPDCGTINRVPEDHHCTMSDKPSRVC